MSDKVKISFTVDLDEVPEKSKIIIRDCVVKLQLILSNLSSLERTDITESQVLELITNLGKYRESLSLIDMLLEDYTNILVGYHSQKTLNTINNLSDGEKQPLTETT